VLIVGSAKFQFFSEFDRVYEVCVGGLVRVVSNL